MCLLACNRGLKCHIYSYSQVLPRLSSESAILNRYVHLHFLTSALACCTIHKCFVSAAIKSGSSLCPSYPPLALYSTAYFSELHAVIITVQPHSSSARAELHPGTHVRKIPRKTAFHMEAQSPSQESLPLITFFPSSGFYIATHRMFYLWYSCKRQKQFKCCSAK